VEASIRLPRQRRNICLHGNIERWKRRILQTGRSLRVDGWSGDDLSAGQIDATKKTHDNRQPKSAPVTKTTENKSISEKSASAAPNRIGYTRQLRGVA